MDQERRQQQNVFAPTKTKALGQIFNLLASAGMTAWLDSQYMAPITEQMLLQSSPYDL